MSLFRWFLLACLPLALLATSACAGDALYLRWGDCPLGASQTPVMGFACDTEAGEHALVCSFTTAQPVDSVLGVEVVVDLQLSDAVLPDWWHLEPTGCRGDALRADQSFGAACQDVWLGLSSGGLLGYSVGMPRGGPNQARITVGFAVPSNQPRALNATDMYYAARLVLSNAGTASCSGCSGAACLVLESIQVLRPSRPPGAPSGDVVITAPGAGNGNWAGWETLTSASCQAVPVRTATWGQIKSLYR